MTHFYIRVRLHKFWSAGSGIWVVVIERPEDPIRLVRPVAMFLQDKTWNHFERFPKVLDDGAKTL